MVNFRWRPDSSHTSEATICHLLELGRFYDSKDARNHALKLLHPRRFSIPPAKLISLALKYHIKDVFCDAFNRLIPYRVNDLKEEDYELITYPVWMAFIRVKERLELHRRIVACEPPKMEHASGCQDQQRCLDDWRQVWWNGMGRFLLDGRNPLTFYNAAQAFESLRTGAIHPDCWKTMLTVVRGGKAFDHERILIQRTAQGLAEVFIHEYIIGDIAEE